MEVRIMSRNSWLHLDDLRESWLFLVVGRASQPEDSSSSVNQIDYWELGVGNPEKLVETTALSLEGTDVHSQTELVSVLLDELSAYRYQDTLLATPDRSTLQRLRTSLVAADVEKPSLRGFAHIDIESQLESQFGQSLEDYGLAEDERQRPRMTDDDQGRIVSTGTVKRFWELWTRVYRLLPIRPLQGVPL
jgi:hypothetical protein